MNYCILIFKKYSSWLQLLLKHAFSRCPDAHNKVYHSVPHPYFLQIFYFSYYEPQNWNNPAKLQKHKIKADPNTTKIQDPHCFTLFHFC